MPRSLIQLIMLFDRNDDNFYSGLIELDNTNFKISWLFDSEQFPPYLPILFYYRKYVRKCSTFILFHSSFIAIDIKNHIHSSNYPPNCTFFQESNNIFFSFFSGNGRYNAPPLWSGSSFLRQLFASISCRW